MRLQAFTLIILCFFAGQTKADFIVSLSTGAGVTGPGGPAVPAGVNGKLTSYSFQGPDRIVTNGINGAVNGGASTNDDFTGPGAANPNFVNISLDVYALNAPMVLNFTVQPQTSVPPAGDPIGPVEYFFTVTLRNQLNANGIHPAVAGREIGGFRVDLTPGAALAAFDAPQNPAFGTIGGADPFPLKFGGFITPTSIQYGGLSGGGGGLGFGNDLQIQFSVDVPGSSNVSPPRTFSLAFTANPEPGSLAFAGLLGTVGAFYARKRRRQTADQLNA